MMENGKLVRCYVYGGRKVLQYKRMGTGSNTIDSRYAPTQPLTHPPTHPATHTTAHPPVHPITHPTHPITFARDEQILAALIRISPLVDCGISSSAMVAVSVGPVVLWWL